MFKLIRELWIARLLTPVGLMCLLEAMVTTGVNPMALLRAAAKLTPNRMAVVDDNHRLTYLELWKQAESVAVCLHADYDIQRGQKVAIACRDHAATVKSIFAASRLGAHVFLVNPGMSPEQLIALQNRKRFDLWVYDEHLHVLFSESSVQCKSIPAYHPTAKSIDRISQSPPESNVRLKRSVAGSIVVMTGGTTGQPKSASRKTSVFTFVPPFFALLTQVRLARHQSVYIATPMYHGFGLASLFIGVVLRVTMYFSSRFDAERACSLVQQEKVDVVTMVPLMLQRMIAHDSDALSSLKCIVCGGAKRPLSPTLAQETLERIGPILFNMYGTSEAGVCIMATPEKLSRKPSSIGKPIAGVRARIADDSDREVSREQPGRLCIRSAWTTSRQSWVETGDVAFRDSDGDVFLCGRVDDMIVSGGENVYPIELENVLDQHPDIESCAVIGIADAEFGQRLKAVITLRSGKTIDDHTVREWLKPRIARHQMPAMIEFRDALPYTALGKIDKKALKGDR